LVQMIEYWEEQIISYKHISSEMCHYATYS
jgi:hypothetical protein